MKIGKIIKQIRKDYGYSQKDLADKIHITQAYLSQIESDKKLPSIQLIEEIGKITVIPLPVILYLSIEDTDVTKDRRELYNLLRPTITKMIEDIFLKEI